jgi:hypothetical protein
MDWRLDFQIMNVGIQTSGLKTFEMPRMISTSIGCDQGCLLQPMKSGKGWDVGGRFT